MCWCGCTTRSVEIFPTTRSALAWGKGRVWLPFFYTSGSKCQTSDHITPGFASAPAFHGKEKIQTATVYFFELVLMHWCLSYSESMYWSSASKTSTVTDSVLWGRRCWGNSWQSTFRCHFTDFFCCLQTHQDLEGHKPKRLNNLQWFSLWEGAQSNENWSVSCKSIINHQQ